MSNSNQAYPTAFRTNGQTVVNCANEVYLNRLAAVRDQQMTPKRENVQQHVPHAPIKGKNGGVPVFTNYTKNSVLCKALFPQ